MIFHAGTKIGKNMQAYTDGGRVLTVVAVGRNIAEAKNKVYQDIPKVYFEGCYYRKDIAAREVI